jgi:hypothetical protein
MGEGKTPRLSLAKTSMFFISASRFLLKAIIHKRAGIYNLLCGIPFVFFLQLHEELLRKFFVAYSGRACYNGMG